MPLNGDHLAIGRIVRSSMPRRFVFEFAVSAGNQGNDLSSATFVRLSFFCIQFSVEFLRFVLDMLLCRFVALFERRFSLTRSQQKR